MDIWHPRTFDTDLQNSLTNNNSLILDYWAEEKRVMDAYCECECAEPLQSNIWTRQYMSYVEYELTPMLEGKPIRIWHYSRLLDHEIDAMKQKLILSTEATLHERLTAVKDRGILTAHEVDVILDQSPFRTQLPVRSNKFYATPCPLSAEHAGVKPFLERWGGESAHFHLRDTEVSEKLKTIGTPCIVEIELKIESHLNAYSSANSVASAWARQSGARTEPLNFVYCVKDPNALMIVNQVHKEGEALFQKLGTTYPEGYETELID